ncbi:MAG: uracil-DNA glycosylase [Pirellulales bacterium]|nr:uracil-DNA glycosylase [Pirellulales bacterium]
MSGRAVRQRLQSLELAGVTCLPKNQRRVGTQRSSSHGREQVATSSDAHEQLQILRDDVAQCQKCPQLASSRTQTVFGAGSVSPRLCFLGEAPGADEDASGIPFVGRAGKLLTKIIEACTLSREDVYILNVLKCRPPENRRPHPEEVDNCRSFFEQQLEIVRPEFICCLGASAAHALLETTQSIGSLRKKWFEYKESRVICTYHPSYLLRNPSAKRDVWEDMKRLMEAMQIQLPAR